MKNEEYARLKTQIDQEHQRKLEALELIFGMTNREPSIPAPERVVRRGHGRRAKGLSKRTYAPKGSIGPHIKAAVASMYRNKFGAKDVCAWIKTRNLPIRNEQVQKELFLMRKKGNIKIVKTISKGRGKRNVYCVV